jgi:glycosyltransferase involved in cell wall biosynthesis
MPIATVVMPVYNAALFLHESIQSVLCQSFSDFKLHLIDDGSQDQSLDLMRHYATQDSRIVVSQNRRNQGLVSTLNRGISEAIGDYIIRMDADDICLPNRFERQIHFLYNNPRVVAVGSAYTMFGRRSDRVQLPEQDHEIKAELCFRSALAHPTVVIRRKVLKVHNLQYSASDHHAEDYGLWTRLSNFGDFYNFKDPLLKYRWHGGNISVTHQKRQAETADSIRERYIKTALGLSDSDPVQMHSEIVNGVFDQSDAWINAAVTWLDLIVTSNRQKQVFSGYVFERKIDHCASALIHFLRQLNVPVPEKLMNLKRDLVCNRGWFQNICDQLNNGWKGLC